MYAHQAGTTKIDIELVNVFDDVEVMVVVVVEVVVPVVVLAVEVLATCSRLGGVDCCPHPQHCGFQA